MYIFLLNLASKMCTYVLFYYIYTLMLSLMLIYLVIDAIFRLAIRDYWDLGKEGAKDDKFVVLVSFWETPARYLR